MVKHLTRKMVCEDCDGKVDIPESCPYTGHKYGEGYVYVCKLCRGELVERKGRV